MRNHKGQMQIISLVRGLYADVNNWNDPHCDKETHAVNSPFRSMPTIQWQETPLQGTNRKTEKKEAEGGIILLWL